MENRDPADFTDVDEFQQATTEVLEVQQGIFEELCTGAALESEIFCNAARVAAGAGSKGHQPAVAMLRQSFKGQARVKQVEELLRKHNVATRDEWVLDALWLLIDTFRADPPWPGVIVEIMKEAAPATLAAFTELLAGWVEIMTKEVEEDAVSKATLVFVYDKDNTGQPWARARLTGKSKLKEGSATVTLIEASRGNLAEPLWVDKGKHVFYPGYDGGGALLFEAVLGEQLPLIRAILDANVSIFSFDRSGSTVRV